MKYATTADLSVMIAVMREESVQVIFILTIGSGSISEIIKSQRIFDKKSRRLKFTILPFIAVCEDGDATISAHNGQSRGAREYLKCAGKIMGKY